MQDKIERKRLAILRILKEANETVGLKNIEGTVAQFIRKILGVYCHRPSGKIE